MAWFMAVPHRWSCQEILARRCAAGLVPRGAPGSPAASLVTAGNLRGAREVEAHGHAPLERIAVEVALVALRLALAVRLDDHAARARAPPRPRAPRASRSTAATAWARLSERASLYSSEPRGSA